MKDIRIILTYFCLVCCNVITFFTSVEADLNAVYTSQQLFGPLPYIGNGHIGTTLFEDYVYLEGLYTGDGPYNHRAAIPSTINVRYDVSNATDSRTSYTLNMEHGYFQVTVSTPTHVLNQKLYCHLWMPEVMVMEVEVHRHQNSSHLPLNISMVNHNPSESVDVVYDDRTPRNESGRQQQVHCQSGRRRKPGVCVVNDVLDAISFPAFGAMRQQKIYITSIDRDIDVALEKYTEARKEADAGVLWSRHVDAWSRRWADGRITFQPAANAGANSSITQLAQATYASFYYLLSSLPDHPSYRESFAGLSNEGLGSNDDLGRVRWEQEMYMFDPLLMLHPDTANLILQSRISRLSEAVANARPDYRGARYPYATSAFGTELNSTYHRALYPSGAVALAIRDYIRTAKTLDYLALDELNRTARAIAEFYANLTINGAIPDIADVSAGQSSRTVLYHALTNALAVVALNLPGEFGEDTNGVYSELARQIQANTRTRSTGGILCHENTVGGLPVTSQATEEPDLLLVYLPIADDNFTESNLLLNDLTCHTPTVPIRSASYTFLRLALYKIALKNTTTSTALTSTGAAGDENNFQTILAQASRHFGVIPQSIDTSIDTDYINNTKHTSLVSHGSFLQLILFGYAGIQLKSDRLVLHPEIPSGAASWSIKGFDYRGFILDFTFTQDNVRISARGLNTGRIRSYIDRLQVNGDGWQQTLLPSGSITTKLTRLEIMASTSSGNHWSKDPFIFETTKLPESRFMPEVGNGHIATVALSPWVHMNGLYNGQGSASSRARIPSVLNFTVSIPDATLLNQSYALNAKEGIFTETKYFQNPIIIMERQIFAHRVFPNLLVSRMVFNRSVGGDAMEITLEGLVDENLLESDDILFKGTTRPRGTKFRLARGETFVPEVPEDSPLPVFVSWYSSVELYDRITLPSTGLIIDQIVSIGAQEEVVLRSLSDALAQGFNSLRSSHLNKWDEYWDNGRIEVEANENFELAQALNGAFYYLLSSLPNYDVGNGTFVGLSPGGLARGAAGEAVDQDYLGHSFWDTEMWMYPPILHFHPDQARLLIQARTRLLQAAKQNALSAGLQGAKFPWESALSGRETTPWPPAGQFQLHVTADIAFAVRQLLYATSDKVSLIEDYKLDIFVEEIARFWQSRGTCEDRGYGDICSINSVMGPDEYHYPVNNSVFTNYVARLALTLPQYVLGIMGRSTHEAQMWAETASKIPIIESHYEGQLYHPEFEGFSPDQWHPSNIRKQPMVKQADVILLGYPLDMEMSHQMRENDLEIYRYITNPEGPAMTWGMFTIGYLELKRKFEADNLFEKYTENLQPPFGVWSEERGGGGAVNFLTGMGGFLQSVINGYGGFRLRENELAFDPTELPRTTKWSVIGMKYLDHEFDFHFDFQLDIINISTTNKTTDSAELVLETASGVNYLLMEHVSFSYRREASKIRYYNAYMDTITHPATGETIPPVSSSMGQFLPSASVVLAVVFMIVYCLPGFL